MAHFPLFALVLVHLHLDVPDIPIVAPETELAHSFTHSLSHFRQLRFVKIVPSIGLTLKAAPAPTTCREICAPPTGNTAVRGRSIGACLLISP